MRRTALAICLVVGGLAATAGTALAGAPTATTVAASGVTATTATLNGRVNPNKEATSFRFDYGTTTGYGSQTPLDTVSGNNDKAVSAGVTGLTPSTTYHNPDDGVPVAILVLAGLLALLALLALVYAALSRLGWAESRLEPIRRTWREAAFRMGGTWGDFSDWVRVGR